MEVLGFFCFFLFVLGSMFGSRRVMAVLGWLARALPVLVATYCWGELDKAKDGFVFVFLFLAFFMVFSWHLSLFGI